MKRVVAILLLLTPLAFTQDQAEVSRMTAGCGANSVQFDVKIDKKQHPVAPTEPGKAIVYVFRDENIDNMVGIGGVTTRVGVDGTWVGATSTKSYFFFPISPGNHRLCTQRQSKLKSQTAVSAAISLTADAGTAYYFRTVTPQRPLQGEAVKLVPIDPAQAQLLIPQFAHSTFALKNQKHAKFSWF